MWKKIKESKWLYVVLSILLAVILWAYVVKEGDPSIERDISGIPVTFTGTGILTTRSLIITEGAEQTMTLKIEAKAATLAKLSRDTITLTVDVSKIVEPGTYRLMVDFGLPPNVNQVDVGLNSDLSDLYVEFTVAKLETKEVPVQLEFTGTPAEGYQPGDYSITPDTISISGQRELVNQVAYAKVVLSQKDMTETYTGDLAFAYVGSDGEELADLKVQSNVDTVHVIFPIVMSQRIPLTVDLVPGGGATAENVEVKVEPEYLDVTGAEEDFKGFQKIVLGEIDLAEVVTEKKYTFPIHLSGNFNNDSGQTEAVITVAIKDGELVSKEFSVDNISIINVPDPENLTAEQVTQSRLVTIRGAQEAVDAVYQGQIRIVADVAAAGVTTPGRHTIPAKIYVDGSDDVGVVNGNSYNIVVNITQK